MANEIIIIGVGIALNMADIAGRDAERRDHYCNTIVCPEKILYIMVGVDGLYQDYLIRKTFMALFPPQI